jgi:hypothetical protein
MSRKNHLRIEAINCEGRGACHLRQCGFNRLSSDNTRFIDRDVEPSVDGGSRHTLSYHTEYGFFPDLDRTIAAKRSKVAFGQSSLHPHVYGFEPGV